MQDFLIASSGYMILFISPLIILPIGFALVYRLRFGAERTEDLYLRQLNFNIFRYVAYLLAIPVIMLVASVVMGYVRGFPAVLDSMPGLIAAITVTFTWSIYRLVKLVSAKTEFEQQMHASVD
ncbi:MAG: hypothetical protein WD572_07560 [Gammaproteobacteria bacterium]